MGDERKDVLSSEEAVKDFWGELEIFNSDRLEITRDTFCIDGYKDETIKHDLDSKSVEKLNGITKENDMLFFVILYSALKIQMYKYTGSNEFILGSPVYTSDKRKTRSFMSKIIPIQSKIDEEMNIKKLIMNSKDILLEAYRNQFCNLELLMKDFGICDDIMDITPVSIAMENLHNEEDIRYIRKSIKNEILLSVKKNSRYDVSISLTYNSSIFTKEMIELFGQRYTSILGQMLQNLNGKVKDISHLIKSEEEKILHDFNDTKDDYDSNTTIKKMFEEEVKKSRGNTALVFQGKKISYEDLNSRANILARVLKDRGVTKNVIVGVIGSKSVETIVGILAIIKAGGAYLPIDSKYPEERIKYMIEDSGTELLLVESNLMPRIDSDIDVILLDRDYEGVSIVENLDDSNDKDGLAYIIYTSGSTGKPKGVMITQNNVINLCNWFAKKYGLRRKNVLQNTSISFDVSVEEIFGTLLGGGTLFLVDEGQLLSRDAFRNFVKLNDINVVQLVPTTLQEFIVEQKKLDSIKVLICGGESLPKTMKEKVLDLGYNLFNCYGPTETTVDALTNRCLKDKKVVIGKPIANTQVYIVDKNMKLQGIGIPGELCISGDGVAKGYLNRNKLTEERFIVNPFNEEKRMYKTGDLARWLPDGTVEFIGRIDKQVKIRGVRIELGEIENRILSYPKVKSAAVLVKKLDGEKYLCAFIAADEEVSEDEIREYLKESLPKSMIPTYFIYMKEMPLTRNQKIDLKKLDSIDVDKAFKKDYQAPRNDREKKIAQIWEKVLKRGEIGIDDNFFRLGGHSLNATELIFEIDKALNIEIPVNIVFTQPTIRGISEYIEKNNISYYMNIQKSSEKAYYGVSSAQKRLYTLYMFEKESTAYNMPCVFEISKDMDKEEVEAILRKLIDRHDAFRTYFEMIDGKVVQKVKEHVNFNLQERIENDKGIELISTEFIRHFDLNSAPIFRAELVECKKKKYLLMDMHHIISDGESMKILTEEFWSIYKNEELETLPIQYKDFSEWQNAFLESDDIKEQENYWLDVFQGDLPVIDLPIDFKRPVIKSFDGKSRSFKIDEEIVERLSEIASDTGSTINMVLLAAFNVLLSKYCRQDDIIVGMPIAGRPHGDLHNIVGVFINTLALRNNPAAEKSFSNFLEEVKENCIKAFKNQSYQFEDLIDKVVPQRDNSRNPLFDVMFNMINDDSDEENNNGGGILTSINVENKISKFDLSFSAIKSKNSMEIVCEYCIDLFKYETIERICNSFVQVLSHIVSNINIKISDIDVVSDKEKKIILHEFNDTFFHYDNQKTIQELFEHQVRRIPDEIAVIFKDKSLTFKEVNEKSNQIARILRGNGVGADKIVGLMVERSFEMIIGILGILKAGGAYMPIDPHYPKERIDYMLKDSGCNVLVKSVDLLENLDFQGEVLDLRRGDLYKGCGENLIKINDVNNLAYIIYTSGTTGNPKGVMIEHRSIINRLMWMQRKYPFSEADCTLQKTTYTFDVSVCELLMWAVVGSKICMLEPGYEKDPSKIIEVIEKNKITNIHFVPSMLDIFVYSLDGIYNTEVLNSLKIVFCSGEAINKEQVNNFHRVTKGEKMLLNLYGPTEAAVEVTCFKCQDKEQHEIPIGKPIDNIRLYILNHGKMVPIGVPGELHIAGEGLARGYLNRDELTAEKFVEDTFDNGNKMYRTGDLAKWSSDGNIEFLGRIDNQVKIRGFRIELQEIESKILEHKNIREAAVIVREKKSGEKYICAYVVSDSTLEELKLRDFLRKTLPDYMIPSYFMSIDEKPLNRNGKLNFKELPKINFEENSGDYILPRNSSEEKVASIWKDALEMMYIGVNQNFFDLGGHSLKAIQIIGEIKKQMELNLSLKEFLNNPTIEGICRVLRCKNKINNDHIKRIETKDYYETSYGQKRLWFLDKLNESTSQLNLYGDIEISEDLDLKEVESILQKLMMRHESLRTRFAVKNDEIVQIIDDYMKLPVEYVDLTKSSLDRARELEHDVLSTNFKLESGPLIRVLVMRLQDKQYKIIYCMHHIISDGYSMQILKKEFLDLYNEVKGLESNVLEELPIQYRDFAHWQNQLIQNEERFEQDKDFWRKKLDKLPEMLDLKFSSSWSNIDKWKTSEYKTSINNELKEKLMILAKESNTTLFALMTAGFKLVLSDITNQNDILIGTASFGRDNADLQNIIGYFVNTIILRSKIKKEETFKDYLEYMSKNIMESIEHQNYPIELILEDLKIQYPKINVYLNMLNMGDYNKEVLDDIDSKNIENAQEGKFDVTIYLVEYKNAIELNYVYLNRIFDAETIKFISEKYINILEGIVRDTNKSINDIVHGKKKRRRI